MRPLDVANDVVNAAGAADGAPPPAVPHPDEAARAAGEVAALLGAGFVERPPRALPGGGSQEAPPRLHRLRARLQVLLDRDPVRYAARTQELAVLANTIASGCSIQARAFTPQEASDAAAAVCNLGLENWPRHWGEESQDLLGVFQVGWAVLHARVGMYAAERLVAVLASLRCGDGETQRDLAALRIQLARDCRAGTPWRSRDALETLAVLDLPAWAALVGLIDECPVVHAVIDTPPDRPVLAIAADAFAFVSENRQIAQVHAFLRSLPDRLAR